MCLSYSTCAAATLRCVTRKPAKCVGFYDDIHSLIMKPATKLKRTQQKPGEAEVTVGLNVSFNEHLFEILERLAPHLPPPPHLPSLVGLHKLNAVDPWLESAWFQPLRL
jgi:hypothetical protein